MANTKSNDMPSPEQIIAMDKVEYDEYWQKEWSNALKADSRNERVFTIFATLAILGLGSLAAMWLGIIPGLLLLILLALWFRKSR